MTRRTILPLAALAALALPATTAGAKSAPPHVTLRLPSPGHMTVAALAVDVTAKNPKRLPRKVSLGVRRLGALPPSVKVLFATRSIPIRGGRRYAAAVFIVRKRDAAAHLAADAHEPNLVDLIFEGGTGGWGVCRGCNGEHPKVELDDGFCVKCGEARATSQLAAIKDADRRRASRLSALNDLFERDFTEGGDPTRIFGSEGRPPEPSLDTGHYDDGHSFGWGTGRRLALPPPDVIRVEIDLVEDLMERQPAKLVPDLEVATAVDLNGDGAIGPKQQIDTRVGPIVIS